MTRNDRMFFSESYVKYNQYIKKSIIGSHKINSYNADDLVSECFIKAFHYVDTLYSLPDDHLKNYLVAIARSITQDAIKKMRARHVDILDFQIGIKYKVISEISVEELLERNELSHLLFEMLSELPPRDQHVLLYKYFYSFSDERIARLIGIGTPSVRTYLTRAKKKAQRYLMERISVS